MTTENDQTIQFAVRLGTVSVGILDATEKDELQMSHNVAQTFVGERTILLQATPCFPAVLMEPFWCPDKNRREGQGLCYAEAYAAAVGLAWM